MALKNARYSQSGGDEPDKIGVPLADGSSVGVFSRKLTRLANAKGERPTPR